MESRFFRGTEKNSTPQPRLSRRERVQQNGQPSFFTGIVKALSFLFSFLVLLKPLVKLFHIKNIQVTKQGITSLTKELFSTVKFVLLLFLYFTNLGLTWLASLKIFPKKLKEKMSLFLTKLYNKSVPVLDPTRNGQISRLSLVDLSIRNLLAKRNRTNITIGGMAIGIGAIVFLVSIGYGLQSLVVSRVASLQELTQADVSTQLGSKIQINDKALADFKRVENVTSVNPLISVVGTVNYQNSVSDMAVYGVQSDYLKSASLQLLAGHYFENNSLAMVLPQETKQEEQTAVLGASTSNTGNGSIAFDSSIQSIQFTLTPTDWIRVHASPSASSPVIGYTRRTEGVEEGTEVWGGTYLSDDGLGKAGKDAKGVWFGKWISAPVLLWQKQTCDPKTQGDCENGIYIVRRETDGHQVQKNGYFAASNVSLSGTSLLEGQVLGTSTNILGDQTGQGGSIPFVQIASLSAPLQRQSVKTVSLGNNAIKQAVVNVAMLNILGIKEQDAVGKTFQATFTATGNLLANPSQKLQSHPATYTIVGVIAGDKTPIFYVPFIDLRSMGITNFSQARISVASKGELTKARRQIESEGFTTTSVADTVAQINGVFAAAQTVLALLGFVALAVASLGMFNTLTVSLLERTREVGLMKAMGMKSEEVKELFLTESLIMSFFGGIFGLLLGFILGEILSILLSVFAVFKGVGFVQVSYIPVTFIFVILGLSLLVGLVTGIYPARRATKISALNALRYE